MKRSPDERAGMLHELGFKQYAHLPTMQPEPFQESAAQFQHAVAQELSALKKHRIELVAWYLWFEVDDPADDPRIKLTLEQFRRFAVRPQLWVAQSNADYPKTGAEWARFLPPEMRSLQESKPPAAHTPEEQEQLRQAFWQAWAAFHRGDFPKSPEEYSRRVDREARRIAALAALARQYGCRVNLYNHNGWFGMIENELAILRQLKAQDVDDVGLVYNFSHARDALHDDSKRFAERWGLMKEHVRAVNVTGMEVDDGIVIYPSQGDSELHMMRVIQQSGWQGPVGLLVQRPEDAAVALKNARIGLDWLAAELQRPGAGGPKPFSSTN